MEYLPVNKIYHKDENSVSGLVEVSIEGLKYYLDHFCENEDPIQRLEESLKLIKLKPFEWLLKVIYYLKFIDYRNGSQKTGTE